MRSKLFVPASRPELFDKALKGEADALSFDLEDSVAADRKSYARLALQAMLATTSTSACTKVLIVRTNAVDSTYFEDDVRAVVRPGVHMLNLPKPASRDEVRAAVDIIERAERDNGVQRPVRLLLNIETPRALREAHVLAQAHPRVAGLQLGLGDLFEPLQIMRSDADVVRQVMLQVRLAAGEAGVAAYDGAYADIADPEGYAREAARARTLGFLGKSCIHPSQVPLANAAFRPSEAEIAHARRVIAAAAEAEGRGVGAYVVDGRMVDAPFVERARGLLAQARSLGLAVDAAAPS